MVQLTVQSVLRRTALFFLIGLAALAVIVGTSAWLLGRTETFSQAAVAAREVRAATADLKALVQDVESGQRGFLLTDKPSYLEPFERARSQIPQKLALLNQYIADDDAQRATVAELTDRIEAKLAELSQTVDLAQNGQRAEALRVVDSDLGQRLMDETRALFSGLISASDQQYETAVAQLRRTVATLQWVASLGALVILLVVGGAAWTVRRYTRELTAARAEIGQLNQGLEDKVQLRTRDLARANQEVQRFAYIVTHDLRAPLVNIMGFTSELETCLEPLQQMLVTAEADGHAMPEARLSITEDLPEAIGFIRSSTHKMDGLINAILKLSRDGRRELRPETVDLRALFEQSASAVHHQLVAADGEITLEVEVAQIVSDRAVLEQIIGNLLDNAIKYAAAERPLRITIRSVAGIAGLINIEVADNGRGIAAPDHERIFDLFRRAGVQDKPGEGLGLAYVRASVRSLGGDITLTSQLGEGTIFQLGLPRDLRLALRSDAA